MIKNAVKGCEILALSYFQLCTIITGTPRSNKKAAHWYHCRPTREHFHLCLIKMIPKKEATCNNISLMFSLYIINVFSILLSSTCIFVPEQINVC